MRGEHIPSASAPISSVGSSPHARGAPCTLPVAPLPLGIIPACAGSTRRSRRRIRCSRDHPRMRGEHHHGPEDLPCDWGSSPHARGAPRVVDHQLREVGIIPACAGSTVIYQPVYPRPALFSFTFSGQPPQPAPCKITREVETSALFDASTHCSIPKEVRPSASHHRCLPVA